MLIVCFLKLEIKIVNKNGYGGSGGFSQRRESADLNRHELVTYSPQLDGVVLASAYQ